MGLDVRVYTDLEKGNKNDFVFSPYVISKKWEWKIKNLKHEYYIGIENTNLEINYNYSYHGYFRKELYNLVTNKDLTIDEVFKTDDYMSITFGNLIDFADNEGHLDWEVSTILYNDFLKYKEKAQLHKNSEFVETYNSWLEIFKVVSEEKGVIEFG